MSLNHPKTKIARAPRIPKCLAVVVLAHPDRVLSLYIYTDKYIHIYMYILANMYMNLHISAGHYILYII